MITFPTVKNLEKAVLGYQYMDIPFALWGINFVKENVLKGDSLFFTNNIFYPQGGYFYPMNLLNGILVFPLYLFFSLSFSYNIMILMFMILAAVGMYRLTLYVTKNRNAAFYSGLCYSISPIVTTAIHNGTDHLLGLCWVPFFMFYFLDACNNVKIRSVIFSIIFLVLSVTSCWYIGFALGMFIIFFFFYGMFVLKRNKKALLKKVVIISLISTILCAPVFTALVKSFKTDPKSIVVKNEKMTNWLFENLTYADFSDYFKTHPFWLRGKNGFSKDYFSAFRSKYAAYGVYLGYIALLLSLLSLAGKNRVSMRDFWVFCMVFFFLLSLGPNPHINHQKLNIGIGAKVLPYSLINYFLPFSTFVSLPYQFSVIMYLSLFILAGGGLTKILSAMKEKQKVIATLFISACSIFEYIMIAPVPYPLQHFQTEIPSFVKELKKKDGTAIIEIPIFPRTSRSLRPGLFYQIYHGKKVCYGIDTSSGISPPLSGNIFLYYIDRICGVNSGLANNDIWELSPGKAPCNIGEYGRVIKGGSKDYIEIKRALGSLKKLYFSDIIVYKDLMTKTVNESLASFLQKNLGQPYWESDEVALYQIQ